MAFISVSNHFAAAILAEPSCRSAGTRLNQKNASPRTAN
jgi:hypothetical protein